MNVVLRRATLADVPMLLEWDADADVAASGAARGVESWLGDLDREVPWAEELIAEVDHRPVGFMELIDAAAEATHYWGDDVEQGAWALDIWIGRPQDRGRGIGEAMMWEALGRCFDVHGASAVLLDPMVSNTRAHRFYERLGFRLLGARRFDDDECLVYRLGRDER